MGADLQLIPLALAFFAPAFAGAGVLLIGLPILIHLLNRRRFKVVDWAAMDFLLRALRKNRRRIQFEQWLLLAMRCLLLLLLGLALSRPGCADNTLAGFIGRRSGLTVIVLDNSGSMAYEADRPDARTHLDQAKKLAKQIIDRLDGGEAVALITSAKPATAVLATPEFDLKAADAAVDRVEQSYAVADFSSAMQKALEIGTADAREPNKTLCVIDDGTRSGWAGPQADAIKLAFKSLAGVYGDGIVHFNLGLPGQWNQAVVALHSTGKVITRRFGDDYVAQLRGFGNVGGDARQLVWRLDGVDLPGTAPAPADAEPSPITNSAVRPKDGGPHLLTVGLASAGGGNAAESGAAGADSPSGGGSAGSRGSSAGADEGGASSDAGGGDRLAIDDTRRLAFNVESQIKVLIVEGQRGVGPLGGSGAYLRAALAPDDADDSTSASGTRADSYIAPTVISDLELSGRVLGDYRAVVLCDVGQLTAGEADQLRQFVESGGSLLLFMGEDVLPDNYNTILYPRHLLPGPLSKRMSVASDQKGFSFDFKPDGVNHPILRDFQDVENSGLDTAQIFTYWQTALPAGSTAQRVLDYVPLPGGQKDPAITVHALGQGEVLFFSTTANADWTTFPAKPAYVTLMHAMLLGTIGSDDQWQNLTVGDRLITPPTLKLTSAPQLSDAGGATYGLESADGTWQSGPLTIPQEYFLTAGDRRFPIAVNVPPEISDVRVLDDAALRTAMGDVPVRMEGDQLPAETVGARDKGNDMGWSIMLIVLTLAAAESFLAMKFGHHKR